MVWNELSFEEKDALMSVPWPGRSGATSILELFRYCDEKGIPTSRLVDVSKYVRKWCDDNAMKNITLKEFKEILGLIHFMAVHGKFAPDYHGYLLDMLEEDDLKRRKSV